MQSPERPSTAIEPGTPVKYGDPFWRDFFGVFTLLGKFGVAHHCHAEILGDLGLASDLDAAQEAITALYAICIRDGLDWKAERLQRFLADIESSAGPHLIP